MLSQTEPRRAYPAYCIYIFQRFPLLETPPRCLRGSLLFAGVGDALAGISILK